MVSTPDDPTREGPFVDRMSVAAVVVTLVAAIIGLLASSAAREGSKAGVQAQRLAIKAIQVGADADDAAQLQYSRFALLESERRRLGNAWQAREAGQRSSERDIKRLEAVSSQTLSDSVQLATEQTSALNAASVLDARAILGRRQCPIMPLGSTPPAGCSAGDGPGDEAFPRSHFADAGWQAARLAALRDAATNVNVSLRRLTQERRIARWTA
jgi:hypothetical protein